MMSRHRSRTLCLLFLESLLICLCGAVAMYFGFSKGAAADNPTNENVWLKILLLMLIVQGSFYLFDLYDQRMIRQRSMLLIRVIQALALTSITLAGVLRVVPGMTLGSMKVFESQWLMFMNYVSLWLMSLMILVMVVWRWFVMWAMGHPRLTERVLILGTEQNAIGLAREVLDRREAGYKIIGFVGNDPHMVGRSLINPSVVGLTGQLEDLVRLHKPDRIVVAMNDRRGHLPLDLLLDMRLRDGVAIEESTSFYERLTGKIHIEMLRPSWLIFSGNSRRVRLYKQARRALDVVVSFIGLLLSTPVMALAAIAIKLDSRGPVFYTQERVGKHNKVFKIIKLRSMRTDAEANGPAWAGESDPRITRVGRVIRKLRIDELPQFVNVLRNEMTFIGPRPERPVFVSHFERAIPYYSQRHLVKPGVTGWAQIRYPYGASIEDAMEKLQYDLYYIKNQSIVLDAIIIFETIRMVLFGRGAR